MILDLFAGPGGWDTGLAYLGRRDVIGVEWDTQACLTARAAGHRRVQADVAVDPLTFWGRHYEGLIASPPCQGFSLAGKGKGRADTAMLLRGLGFIASGFPIEIVLLWLHQHMTDDRSLLALEPLRYAIAAHRAGKPFRWLAWEQVPAVLPLWEACAVILRQLGYTVETHMLRAEQYGVPQTRKRAILRGTLDPAGLRPLTPTHSRYHERTPSRIDAGMPRWVSMAEGLGWGLEQRPSYTVCAGGSGHAIGDVEWGGESVRAALRDAEASGDPQRWRPKPWGMTDRPSYTVTGGGTAAGGAEPFGRGAREGMQREREAGRFIERDDTLPLALATGTRPGAAVRSVNEPAPTLAFGHDAASYVIVPEGTDPTDVPAIKRAEPNRDEVLAIATERAHNQSGTAFDMTWPCDRPSPVVAGRDLVGMPGSNANRFNGSTKSRNDGIRITVQEAGLLQSFPEDYPWQGKRPDQYRQAGDAVPPLLAAAILTTLL